MKSTSSSPTLQVHKWQVVDSYLEAMSEASRVNLIAALPEVRCEVSFP